MEEVRLLSQDMMGISTAQILMFSAVICLASMHVEEQVSAQMVSVFEIPAMVGMTAVLPVLPIVAHVLVLR